MLKNWFLTTFKYDGFANPPLFSNDNNSKEIAIPKSLGAFTANSSFEANFSEEYKLYHSWTLDSALDIHVCNYSSISGWITIRSASVTV
ncbi:Bgt-20648 [Blumeria graminis f. sp. tritici]|uniref:Bgt-20648 n=2 Tax=Blumeria graminis f. sp. tritici TaxID=62690 RepID=A0A381LC30_BLUGR|nr:Bgt-20648 [Blumeria graminis f. sp. tritici]